MLNRILNNLGRGAFIVVEGCDRSGKSTQCTKLVDHLNDKGIKARLLKFPNRTTDIGQTIDAYLTNTKDIDDRAIHLLFSANRWEAIAQIKEQLTAGITVVVDRYAYSGVAFSSAKGLDFRWCKNPDIGLLTPDLVVFLDLPVEEAEKRGGFGEERYEKRAFQKKVRERFLDLKDRTWKVLDASLSIDELHAKLLEEVIKTIENSKAMQVREDLWKW